MSKIHFGPSDGQTVVPCCRLDTQNLFTRWWFGVFPHRATIDKTKVTCHECQTLIAYVIVERMIQRATS